MKNLGALMKQAQAMQAKMAELQDRLASMEVTGASGGGMVHATVSGKGEVRRIKIDRELSVGEELDRELDVFRRSAADQDRPFTRQSRRSRGAGRLGRRGDQRCARQGRNRGRRADARACRRTRTAAGNEAAVLARSQ